MWKPWQYTRGITCVFQQDIPSKYLRSFNLPDDIHVINIEVNIKQRKLLVVSIYKPPDQKLEYFLSS